MKKIHLVFLLSFYFINQFSYAEHLSKESQILAEKSKPTVRRLRNYRDWIMWIGSEFSLDFNPNSANLADSKRYEVKGLAICEEGARSGQMLFQGILAGYYFYFKKDFKKSLYWAFLSAESGNIDGMAILARAYASGDGLVPDMYEATKWYILSAALGKEDAKINLSVLRTKCAEYYNEGSRRANEWMQSHKNLFFSPD